MTVKLFITGTDTDAGKTYISLGLLRAFGDLKLRTLGIKPVASGCELSAFGLMSQDALALQEASTVKAAYEDINPFAFEAAIAPHIAAEIKGVQLTANALRGKMAQAYAHAADVYLLEGAGGWHTPLNYTETLADFVIAEKLQTILVVGMRLGCINHAILTARAIKMDKISVVGWVANCVSGKMAVCEENIITLKKYLPWKHLGTVGHDGEIEKKMAEEIIKIGSVDIMRKRLA